MQKNIFSDTVLFFIELVVIQQLMKIVPCLNMVSAPFSVSVNNNTVYFILHHVTRTTPTVDLASRLLLFVCIFMLFKSVAIRFSSITNSAVKPDGRKIFRCAIAKKMTISQSLYRTCLECYFLFFCKIVM